MKEEEVNELLDEYSTKKFSIVHGGYKANHISHGIVALYKLGASRDKLQDYIDWYSKRLEHRESQPRDCALPGNHNPKNFNFGTILGKKCSYYPLFEYYENIFKQECKESMDEFIQRCFLPKAVGMIGSAIHPVIHMGFGYYMKNPRLVVEGMAYLHHAYLPLQLPKDNNIPFGDGKTDILDILDEVRNNQGLREMMIKESTRENELFEGFENSLSSFGKRCMVLFTHAPEDIISYVSRIKLPDWYNNTDTTPNMEDVLKLMDWVTGCAIAVYQASKNQNDFFLLHGVTAGWGLQKILSALNETKVLDALFCVKVYLCCLIAVYIVQNSPEIDRYLLKEQPSKEWDEIVKETLESQGDPHIYKLVQVCFERSVVHSSDDKLLKAASLCSLAYPFAR